MKYTTTVFLFFLSCASLHSMELELDLVPLLEKKPALEEKKRDKVLHYYEKVNKDDLVEKLYLARRMPGLMSSKIVRKKIIEYMMQTESNIDYKIALHYQFCILDHIPSLSNFFSDIRKNQLTLVPFST